MLHIARPENAQRWFADAAKAGVTDFDFIGLSYYRKWSTQSQAGLEQAIRRLRTQYPGVGVMVVETAYPWTLKSADESQPARRGHTRHRISGDTAGAIAIPRRPHNARHRWRRQRRRVLETAWTTSRCETRWGRGSSWENATFFDFTRGNEVLPGIDFMRHDYAAAHD